MRQDREERPHRGGDRDRGDRGDRGDRDGGQGGGFKGGGRRGRARPAVDLVFDYKDPDTLRQFITEHGKIIPSRVSRLSAKQQRSLKVHIKRARSLALLPVGTKHINYEEQQGYRRDRGDRDRGDRGDRGGHGGGDRDRGERQERH